MSTNITPTEKSESLSINPNLTISYRDSSQLSPTCATPVPEESHVDHKGGANSLVTGEQCPSGECKNAAKQHLRTSACFYATGLFFTNNPRPHVKPASPKPSLTFDGPNMCIMECDWITCANFMEHLLLNRKLGFSKPQVPARYAEKQKVAPAPTSNARSQFVGVNSCIEECDWETCQFGGFHVQLREKLLESNK